MCVYCLFFTAALRADDSANLILKKIAQTIAAAISRSDNYICAQDLSRFYYVTPKADIACRQPPAIPEQPMRVQDRLKLDVAVSQGSEIYSWHGEHKFSGGSVSEVVRDGPISSGSFNGYLRNIFGERGVKFVYKGRATIIGLNKQAHEVYQFDYNVPLAASHYQVQAGKQFALAPFHGSFAAKADNHELYSLTVTADGDQMPSNSDICSAETTVTYQSVKISSHESLLPASFDLLLGNRNGVFTASKGNYSECREFTGESTVHFDVDNPSTDAAKPAELQTEPLKPGIFLPITLLGQIDEDSAYAGLPVEALLSHDVKVKKGMTLARGATLKGTLTRFEIFHEPQHLVSLKIEFDSITDGEKLYLCKAVHEVSTTLVLSPSFGGGARRQRGMPPVRTVRDDDDDDGSMTFNTPHMHLDRSFTSMFITIAHPETESR